MFTAMDLGTREKIPYEMWYCGEGSGIFLEARKVEQDRLDAAAAIAARMGNFRREGKVHGYSGSENDYDIVSWKIEEAVVAFERLKESASGKNLPGRVIKIFARNEETIFKVQKNLYLTT